MNASAEPRLGAGGGDVDDDGDLRRELGLDDVLHRVDQPARRVEQDHGCVEVLALGPLQLVDDEVARDWVDVVVELDGENARPFLCGERDGRPDHRRGRHEEQNPRRSGLFHFVSILSGRGSSLAAKGDVCDSQLLAR